MPGRGSPETGDVVLRQETRDGMVVYVLRTTPGTDQYLLRTREQAVVQALTFAKRQGVRAWLIDESDHSVPLTNGRNKGALGAKHERPMPGGLRPAGG